MSDTYEVKVVAKDERSVDLAIRAIQDDVVGPWPGLAIRALEAPETSPIYGAYVYDPDDFRALVERWIDRVELLDRKAQRKQGKATATFRVHVRDAALIAALKKGQKWGTAHYDPDGALVTGAAAFADGKRAVFAWSTGVAEVVALGSSGEAVGKAWLDHPGLAGVAVAGETVLTGGGTEVRAWDAGGTRRGGFDVGSAVRALRASPEGDRVAVAAAGGASLWSLDGRRLATMGPAACAVAFAGDEVVVGAEDGRVRVFGADGTPRRVLEGLEQAVTVLDAAPGAVVAADRDGRAHAWHGDARTPLPHTITRHRFVAQLAELPDGSFALRTKDIRGRGPILVATPGLDAVTERAPDGRHTGVAVVEGGLLLTATTMSSPGEARVIGADGAVVAARRLPTTRAARPWDRDPVRVSPDGRRMLVPVTTEDGAKGRVDVHDLVSGAVVSLPNPRADYDFLTDAAFLVDGEVLVGYGNHPPVRWSAEGTRLQALEAGFDMVEARPGVVVTASGGTLLRRGPDLAPVARATLDLRNSVLHHLEVGADGRYVLAGVWAANEHRAWVWDTVGGDVWEIPGSPDVGGATFGGSAGRVATWAYDRPEAVQVWDVATRRLATTAKVERCPVGAGLRDERSVVVATRGGIARYDAGGERIAEVRLPESTTVTAPVTVARLLPGGRVLTASEEDEAGLVWTGAAAAEVNLARRPADAATVRKGASLWVVDAWGGAGLRLLPRV